MTEQEMDALIDRFADACYAVGFEHGRGKLDAPTEEQERYSAETAIRDAMIDLRALSTDNTRVASTPISKEDTPNG